MPEFVRCPTCRELARWEGNRFRPFCSERCKDHDLGAWATERHRIPGEPVPTLDERTDDEEDE